MSEPQYSELDMQAEYFRGQKSGARQAKAVLREKTSNLWYTRPDEMALLTRNLADELKALAVKYEIQYRQKLQDARAAEVVGGE